MNLTTKNLAGNSITFDETDGVFAIGYKVVSGPVTITGNKPFKGVASEPIELATGDTNMITTINRPISGLTINASAGIVALQIYW
jgi:hypothetical protein